MSSQNRFVGVSHVMIRRWLTHVLIAVSCAVSALGQTPAEPSYKITPVGFRQLPEWDYAFVSAETNVNKLSATLSDLTPKAVMATQGKLVRGKEQLITTFHGASLDPAKPFTVDVGFLMPRGTEQ